MTQGLEDALDSKGLEGSSHSSNPLMAGASKEAPDAGIPSNPESPQRVCSSSIALASTSTSELNEGSSSQEKADDTSCPGPDATNEPTDPLDEPEALLVNFMLCKYLEKQLMTKADMKIVIKEYEDQFPEIFLKASKRMEVVFGLDVKEVDPINHTYGLFIKLGLTYDGLMHGELGIPKTGLLILVLGVILMNGNIAAEKEVWEVLNFMGIYAGKKHHAVGEPKKLITHHFVKEKYLVHRQVAKSDPAQFEFLWGPRARAETTKMKVLQFLTKVQGTHPSSYPSQYEDALRDEEERARARTWAMKIFLSQSAGRF